MENFSYHVPFYVVSGGVDLAGHSSELSAGQVGLFDRSTFSVATAAGNGKELFFAQGSLGGKDWHLQTPGVSHKSPFFYPEQVEDMYVSHPHRIINEEWVIGFNGSVSSQSLKFETGKAVRIKFLFTGEPSLRFFGTMKEYVVSYTPPEPCVDDCVGSDCPDPIVDCLTHTQALVNLINEHIEMKKFGVQAQLVNAPYTAATANMEKYSLTICDNGDAIALQRVQAQYPTKNVTRISRVGSNSVYEFCQPTADAAPADFANSGSVLLAVCGACPGGSTLTAAKDVYLIRRVLTPTSDLTSDAAKDTYADTVGTAYGVATDADKVFIGQDGAEAIVSVKVPEGTEVTALVSDSVEFSHTEPAICTWAAAASVAWVASGEGFSSSRSLILKNVNRPDCDADGDRLEDIETAIAGIAGVDTTSLALVEGVGCVDDYTVTQTSLDCLSEEECLSNHVTFRYEDLPAFEGSAWEVVPPVVTDDATRECGIRVTAGYYDPKFGNCSFDPRDYYQNEPVKMEVSLLQEDGSVCDVAEWPTVHQTRFGQIARQSGEYIVREVLMKTDAYQRHMNQFSMDNRERESFDMNLLSTVDRNAFYKLYYVSFPASYGAYTWRKNEQEKFTAVFAFKEDDPQAKIFEDSVLSVLTAKSGKSLHVEL